MITSKITNDILSIGVLNPNMRIFDIIMKTEYGTSYNAYVVDGGEKVALIETVHLDFFDLYIENLKKAVSLDRVEYLVVNHSEPDHSGSIKRLLEVLPNIKIVASQACSLYLKNIVNSDSLNIIVAKDGDEIKLGSKTLSFINAPFLHWPDSMFTYVKEDKTLFPCDFLGTHYCEPTMIDTKLFPKYKKAYDSAMFSYYQAIFSPFKPYVLKGLDKIKDLNIEFACVSHGPVLTKQGFLPEVMEKYRIWSTPQEKTQKIIPIFYCSAYGNTRMLANAIKSGVDEVLPTAFTQCYDLNEHDMAEMGALINSCDACLIGSPTLNKDAVAPIWQLLSHIDAINFGKRHVGLFGSYGWSGEAFANLRGRLIGLKANVVENDLKVVLVPTENDLNAAKEYGVNFAKALA